MLCCSNMMVACSFDAQGLDLCLTCQVWDNTPSVGEAPFLDSIWTALDEVRAVQAHYHGCCSTFAEAYRAEAGQ